MNKIYTFRGLILCLYFISSLTLTSVYASHSELKENPVQWLFVISAKNGEIRQNDNKEYILSLEHTQIERVLMFSDRPNRIVKFISPKNFQKMWGEGGQNSFKNDPPNAIAVFGQEKIAMKLIRVSVDKDRINFVITSDDSTLHDHKKGAVSIFIDFHVEGIL